MWGSQGDMHTSTDACTHSNHDVGAEKGYLAHADQVTQGHIYLYRTMQGSGAHVHSQVDMHTCTDEYTHIHKQHILTKVWEYKRGDWDTHAGPNSSKQFCM